MGYGAIIKKLFKTLPAKNRGAQESFERQGSLSERSRVCKAGADSVSMARIYTMVGEYDEAIRLLETAMSESGYLGIGALRLDPAWKPLHDKPEFQALVRKYGR